MIDREKVIKGLEKTMETLAAIRNMFKLGFPNIVTDIYDDSLMAVSDALALLEAQEPRVISWQYAESMRLCWIETRRPHTISPADLIHYFDESPTITVFKIHQNAIDWPLDEYGIKWRCWDKEPTDEQMEAKPWN